MFTHLHLHTDYSLLDGTIQLPPLIQKIKEHKMTACAVTDHGNMYGSFKFWNMMKAEGLKPVIGCEIYVSPREMSKKEYGIDNKYFHLVLLAKNLEGYKNLLKVVSIGHIDGFYFKPRIDFETLSKHSEGIIALSACMGGVIAKHILNGDMKSADEATKKFSELYKDNFYIEVQRNGVEGQEKVNEGLLELAKKYNLPIVATCDSHYLNKEDSELQEILWCIRDGKTFDDPTREKAWSDQFYVKSSEEMEELFKDLPEAIENTQKIVDSIEDFNITFGRVEPVYLDLPEGMTSKDYLQKLAYEGAPDKYGALTEDLKKRLDYELGVINEKGYNDYFLIVRSFIMFCRENGIIVGMRGSGCGSAVAYCIGITNVEPIKWELYFERFLNPERKSAPDFDIDISDRHRDKVVQFTINKFGEENVKKIGTFSKLQTRQAIKDVSRVLGVDLAVSNQLSKMVEIVFGKAKPIDYMIENNPEFAQIINSNPLHQKMSKIVKRITGLCRGVSTHACGIIITPNPVVEYVPIQKDAHGDGMGMTQYDMADNEAVGLMKYDFLGLRNLFVIGEALIKIKKTKNEDVNLLKLDPHDSDSFELIQSGHTVGIFQMESEGMRKTIKNVAPMTQEEICYLLAAYRPGPMQFIPEYVAVKNKEKDPEYLVDDLKPILSITNGVITYQEQVIRIAVDIAGYTMGSADVLRKAMGKKKMDVMEAEKPKFIDGAVAKGHSREKIEQLWDRLLQFANYGFNKAHSASYALVSYWTAYLKSHYPLEFMAALLEGDLDNFDRVVLDLEECSRLGIAVNPPDINLSGLFFTIEGDKAIRFGLGGIKNVGEDVIQTIVDERKANGPYKHLDDFIYRLIEKKVQQRSIEYLVMAGTMDEFGERNALLKIVPEVYEKCKRKKEVLGFGQIDIFGMGAEENSSDNNTIDQTPLPEVEPASINEMLVWEKDLLGVYLRNHPLDDLQEFFETKGCISIRDAATKKDKELVVLGAMVTKIRRILTKKKENMAFLTVEDKTGMLDIIVFPRTYEEIKDELQPNAPMLIAGRVNIREKERAVILQKAKVIDKAKLDLDFKGVVFKVNDDHSESEIEELKNAIRENPGKLPVKIVLTQEGKYRSIVLKQTVAINPTIRRYMTKFS